MLRSFGFTLFELLVVLLIASISVTLIAPGLFNTLAGVQEKVVVQEVAADIADMRMYAFLHDRQLDLEFEGDTMRARMRLGGGYVIERTYSGVRFRQGSAEISAGGYFVPPIIEFLIGGELHQVTVAGSHES